MLYFALNPHNIERTLELRDKYNTEAKILAIDTFIDPASSGLEALTNYLENIGDNHWSYSIHPWKEGTYNFPRDSLSPEEATEGIASARRGVFVHGGFGYNFDRCEHTRFESPEGTRCAVQNILEDECPLCGFVKFMGTPEVLTFLSTITGHDLTAHVSLFASRYRAESFLSIHQDNGRGKVALVFNLTRSWNPAWGGALQMVDWNYQDITRTITPRFNTLAIFEVVGQGVPHHVTSIPREVTGSRLAVTGWMD